MFCSYATGSLDMEDSLNISFLVYPDVCQAKRGTSLQLFSQLAKTRQLAESLELDSGEKTRPSMKGVLGYGSPCFCVFLDLENAEPCASLQRDQPKATTNCFRDQVMPRFPGYQVGVPSRCAEQVFEFPLGRTRPTANTKADEVHLRL